MGWPATMPQKVTLSYVTATVEAEPRPLTTEWTRNKDMKMVMVNDEVGVNGSVI